MRFDELKRRAAFQAEGDADEAEELSPYLEQYVAEGYERLARAYGMEAPSPLLLDRDEPCLPEWAHPAMADFAAWMLLRNGSPQRQARALQFRASFEEVMARMYREGSKAGRRTQFTGIYP